MEKKETDRYLAEEVYEILEALNAPVGGKEEKKKSLGERFGNFRISFWRKFGDVFSFVGDVWQRVAWWSYGRAAKVLIRRKMLAFLIDPETGAVSFDRNRVKKLAGIDDGQTQTGDDDPLYDSDLRDIR